MNAGPRRSGRDAGRSAGFTLIEVMGAVLLTSIVIGAAVSFYVQLSQASEDAIARSRAGRAAIATLDRVARDLEGAYLLSKPPEVDPLDHPWLFVAESRYSNSGSDHLKFITHSHTPRSYAGHASSIAEISYALFRSEDGEEEQAGYELWRRVIPRLPEALDRDFPRYDDENAMLVAQGIADFSIRLQDEYGEWVDEWDSTLLLESSRLPIAAEIRLTMLGDGGGVDDRDNGSESARGYVRRVLIPVRPISLEELLEKQTGGPDGPDDENGGELTLRQCMGRNPAQEALFDEVCESPPVDLAAVCAIRFEDDVLWSDVLENYPGIKDYVDCE